MYLSHPIANKLIIDKFNTFLNPPFKNHKKRGRLTSKVVRRFFTLVLVDKFKLQFCVVGCSVG
jgi:hypothetical protein